MLNRVTSVSVLALLLPPASLPTSGPPDRDWAPRPHPPNRDRGRFARVPLADLARLSSRHKPAKCMPASARPRRERSPGPQTPRPAPRNGLRDTRGRDACGFGLSHPQPVPRAAAPRIRE
jgi:hypothetical protein